VAAEHSNSPYSLCHLLQPVSSSPFQQRRPQTHGLPLQPQAPFLLSLLTEQPPPISTATSTAMDDSNDQISHRQKKKNKLGGKENRDL